MLRSAFLASAATALLLRGRESMSLEPDYVADLLLSVQEQWINDAVTPNGLLAMQESCSKIASSIVQGSEGDVNKVDEYLDIVCSQNVFTKARPWMGDLCRSFAQKMTAAMKSDAEYNRNYLDVRKVCSSLYSDVEHTGAVEDKRREQAKKEEEEAAKKRAAEEAKQAAEKKKKSITDAVEKKKRVTEEGIKKAAEESRKKKQSSMDHATTEMAKAHAVENHAKFVSADKPKPAKKEEDKAAEHKKHQEPPAVEDKKAKSVSATIHAVDQKPKGEKKDVKKPSPKGPKGPKKMMHFVAKPEEAAIVDKHAGEKPHKPAEKKDDEHAKKTDLVLKKPLDEKKPAAANFVAKPPPKIEPAKAEEKKKPAAKKQVKKEKPVKF